MQLTWLIINAAAVLAALAWVYKRYALVHVTYSRTFTKSAAYTGDEVEMVECIANRKLLPLPWVRLESMFARGLVFGHQTNLDIRSGEKFQNHISLFSLRSYRQIVRRHRVSCMQRGYYRLDSATMTAGDPMGLVRPSARFPLSISLTVYPKIIPFAELPLPNHSWLGDIAVRRWIVEDPFFTAGTREYRSGDTLRSVNWKATARAGSLQVHQNDFTADHRLMICLNLETHEKMWNAVIDRDRIERGLSLAASVAAYAINNGIETGFLCNGWVLGQQKRLIRVEPSGGGTHMELLLDQMAKLELETVMTMPALLDTEIAEEPKDTDYVIISCHRGAMLQERVDELVRRGNGAEWMIIPEEGETGGAQSEDDVSVMGGKPY
jgi:hypothetical protein